MIGNMTATAIPLGDPELTWKGCIFIATVVCMTTALLSGIAPMFSVMIASTACLYLFEILEGGDVFIGLTNNGVLAIAMLFVIVHPIAELPLLRQLVRQVMKKSNADLNSAEKKKTSTHWARLKLCSLSMLLSSWLENAPQVAIFVPLVSECSSTLGVPPSQLLMPMNVCVLTGNFALLGASSNIVLSGLMEHNGYGPMPFFELAKANSFVIIPVLLYCVLAPKYILANKEGSDHTFFARLLVGENSLLAGCTMQAVFARFFIERPEVDVEEIIIVARGGERIMGRDARGTIAALKICVHDEITICGRVNRIAPPRGQTGGQDSADAVVNALAGQMAARAGDGPTGEEVEEMRTAGDNLEESLMGDGGEQPRLRLPPLPVKSRSRATSVQSGPMLRFAMEAETELFTLLLECISPVASHRRAFNDFEQRFGVTFSTLQVSVEGDDLYHLHERESGGARPNLVVSESLAVGDNIAQEVRAAEQMIGATQNAEDHQHGGSSLVKPTGPIPGHWKEPGWPLPTYFVYVPKWWPLKYLQTHENSVHGGKNIYPLPDWYSYMALLVFIGVVVAAVNDVRLSNVALIAACSMVLLGLCTTEQVTKSLPIPVFLLVAFSFPVGIAMQKSGVAAVLGKILLNWNLTGFPLLLVIGVVTVIAVNLITNQGALQVMFPIVKEVYAARNLHPMPGFVMLAACLCFAFSTPFAIPSTALIVAPGNYKATDFLKFGVPLTLILIVVVAIGCAVLYDDW
jgi:Na+/H+ antiporter NhaD/arsenite permease-like protein